MYLILHPNHNQLPVIMDLCVSTPEIIRCPPTVICRYKSSGGDRKINKSASVVPSINSTCLFPFSSACEMSATKVNCVEVLQKPIWVLKITGLWPLRKLNAIVLSKLVFNIVFDVVTLIIVLQNIVVARNTKNLRLLNWMICILLPLTNFFAKTVPLWFNRESLQSILNDLNSYDFNSHSDKLNKHIQKIDKISKLIWRYFGLAMTAFVSAFSILPFIIKIQPMIPAPFKTGNYDVVYKSAHLFATSYLSINSASVDVFYMSLISLCGAQINILEHKLINVLDDAKTSSVNCDGNLIGTTVEDILKECIVLHETINK